MKFSCAKAPTIWFLLLFCLAGCEAERQYAEERRAGSEHLQPTERLLPQYRPLADGASVIVQAHAGRELAGRERLSDGLWIESFSQVPSGATTSKKPMPSNARVRIARHGEALTFTYMEATGAAESPLEVRGSIHRSAAGSVLGLENHEKDGGYDTPVYNITIRDEYYVTATGDLLIREQRDRSGWAIYRPLSETDVRWVCFNRIAE